MWYSDDKSPRFCFVLFGFFWATDFASPWFDGTVTEIPRSGSKLTEGPEKAHFFDVCPWTSAKHVRVTKACQWDERSMHRWLLPDFELSLEYRNDRTILFDGTFRVARGLLLQVYFPPSDKILQWTGHQSGFGQLDSFRNPEIIFISSPFLLLS